MNHFFTRTTAASLALTLFPFTGFAYSLNYFQSQNTAVSNESDIELLEQQWDTQCRDQLGIQGGNLLGALKANLNRCINTQRRQISLKKYNSTRRNRILNRRKNTNIQAGIKLNRRIKNYQRRTYQKRLRTRIEFRKSLPQSKNQKQKSFRYVRSRNRISVQAKEQSILTTKKKRSMYIIKARMSCKDLRLNDKAQCILKKLDDLMSDKNVKD